MNLKSHSYQGREKKRKWKSRRRRGKKHFILFTKFSTSIQLDMNNWAQDSIWIRIMGMIEVNIYLWFQCKAYLYIAHEWISMFLNIFLNTENHHNFIHVHLILQEKSMEIERTEKKGKRLIQPGMAQWGQAYRKFRMLIYTIFVHNKIGVLFFLSMLLLLFLLCWNEWKIKSERHRIIIMNEYWKRKISWRTWPSPHSLHITWCTVVSSQTTIGIPFQIYNISILSFFIRFVFLLSLLSSLLFWFILSFFISIWMLLNYSLRKWKWKWHGWSPLFHQASSVWLTHTHTHFQSCGMMMKVIFITKHPTFSLTIVNQDIVYTELNLYFISIKWIPYYNI